MKKLWLGLLVIQALVNLVGALGPELGFDALWYHLTEAKLFRQAQSLAPIPGNLLYWSGFPRLMEIIYAFLPGKLVHWAFGLGSAWLVYRLGGPAAAVLFYTTLLVGWLSTSAYVDLALTFFILAAISVHRQLWKIFWLALAGATKLTAIPISLIFTGFPWAVLGALPFWIINWRATGNPFYPFGTNLAPVHEWFYSGFWFWLSRPLRLFFDPAFRVGPIILILAILSGFKLLRFYTFMLFLIWFIGPGTDTGRFALPLLAVLSISAASTKSRLAGVLILIHALIGIFGRSYANAKYLPVVLGRQSESQFLTRHLNFDFGDFYDTDGWFAANIKSTDKVLIYNLHNLYYVNFPYDHESWAKPGTYYTHILSHQPKSLPLIYTNPTTGVKVYLCYCYY
jgi:hypothetical protein